jgi:hypothetical protein
MRIPNHSEPAVIARLESTARSFRALKNNENIKY